MPVAGYSRLRTSQRLTESAILETEGPSSGFLGLFWVGLRKADLMGPALTSIRSPCKKARRQ